MIFDTGNDFFNIESYKERNLYYKIFAGYYFNELIDNSCERKEKFLDLLKNTLSAPDRYFDKTNTAGKVIEACKQESLHVTFDYHAIQFLQDKKVTDHGEMSDILFVGNSAFISVECKFLENMDIEYDVRAVQERMKIISGKWGKQALQVLLMKESKWKNSLARESSGTSFTGYLKKESLEFPVLVIFWEEILSLIDNRIVNAYLKEQLKRKKE